MFRVLGLFWIRRPARFSRLPMAEVMPRAIVFPCRRRAVGLRFWMASTAQPVMASRLEVQASTRSRKKSQSSASKSPIVRSSPRKDGLLPYYAKPGLGAKSALQSALGR